MRRFEHDPQNPINVSGSYELAVRTGILAAALAADSELFQFRFDPIDLTKRAMIRKVKISAAVSTTMFAAGVPVQIELFKATVWTAVGTGGTGISPAAMLKRRTSMPSTVVQANDIRIATTAALGAGTKTLESLAMAAIAAAGPITASLNGTIIPPGTVLFQAQDEDHPLDLGSKEGFVIRLPAVPATGTWTAAIEVDWMEYTP